VLIETRGEAGFTIVAPTHGTVHPSGLSWTLEAGGPDTVVHATAEEVAGLHELAREFDQVPKKTASNRGDNVAFTDDVTNGCPEHRAIEGSDHHFRPGCIPDGPSSVAMRRSPPRGDDVPCFTVGAGRTLVHGARR